MNRLPHARHCDGAVFRDLNPESVRLGVPALWKHPLELTASCRLSIEISGGAPDRRVFVCDAFSQERSRPRLHGFPCVELNRQSDWALKSLMPGLTP